MICPACGNQLQEITADNVTVDVCQNGCGGIWFDNYELKKFDEPHEPAQELFETVGEPTVTVDQTQRRQCPRCDGITMLRHFFTVKQQVEIDECQSCGGVWLDYGELEAIRSLFETEEDREQAAHEAFQSEFGNLIAQAEAESEAELAKARRFANFFRFICPSAYIPGKQSWGAF